ncbi:MAG TPA: DNRLRE domain-containing protein [Anaerolineae bacterium]|jgi:hypothetical protein|nr:DNRLRE domain-containing protein [Anaerolineae bacterium]
MFVNRRAALPLASFGLLAVLLLLLAAAATKPEASRALAPPPVQEQPRSHSSLAWTHAVTESGTIQGLVWDDRNGDGQRAAEEPPLTGALLTLVELEGTLSLSQTTGSDGWYAFADLQPALYELTETDPPGYISTTSNQFQVRFREGVTKTVTLNFGDSLPPTPTPTPVWGQMQPTVVACGAMVSGDTRGGVALVSRYGCAPHWQESGPEQVFLLELDEPQEITAMLTADPVLHPDLDLFLLYGPDPSNCLAAGDSSLQHDVTTPGQYYLVVDGYLGQSGPYVLEVDCPLGPYATPTPTPTVTPTPTDTPTPTVTPTPTITPTPSPTVSPYVWQQKMPMAIRGWPPTTPPLALVLRQGAEGYLGVQDTYLDGWAQTTNYADDELLMVRSHDVKAALLKFDLSLLPREAIIASATLSLYAVNSSNPNPESVSVYGVLRPWSNTTTTWIEAEDGEPWEESGCNGVSDRYLNFDDERTLSETESWYTWSVTRLAQLWTTQPAQNYGVVLRGSAVPQVEYRFYASDTTRSDFRPRLEVSYWVPAGN